MTEQEAPPELHFCSRCHDNAAFIWDDLEGWISECCGWPAASVDVEPND